jgi:hypothetical protein
VFVTSTTYSGALGGLAAADAYCQASASNSGLSGVFHAWLSDEPTGAFERTDDVGPWYTTSDALAFSSKGDLQGAPQTQLLDEYGGYPGSGGAWSGSDSGGVATGEDCDGWTNAAVDATATTGSALGSDANWGGGNAPLRCNAKASLICFEQ